MMTNNKRFWKDIDRFIKTIHDEIKTAKPDRVTIDFYLFKIERRFKMLKDILDKNET
jgi:hypothetical protein